MKKKIAFHQSFVFALSGIVHLFARERNVQIHGACALAVIALGFYCNLSVIEWALNVVSISAVITTEALNTAIERCVDLASPDWHALAKEAKDIAAGAVLLASISAAIIGLLIFLPKLI